MEQIELADRYSQLREELDAAYASPVWHAPTIDAIAEQLLPLERALGALQAGAQGQASTATRWK